MISVAWSQRERLYLRIGLSLVLLSRWMSLGDDEPGSAAQQIVERAMQAQVAARTDTSRFGYLRSQLEDRDTRMYYVVESDAGDVQSMVAINEQQLNPKQREEEEHSLTRLLVDPSIQQNRKKKDAEEESRRQKIIAVLGRAFLYETEGTEKEGQLVRLHFRPNPRFHPDSHEAKVCAGLEGKMWIDQTKGRFTRAEGTLVRGVDFGWGIFGHLEKGGTFAIEQTEVDSGLWRITDLSVNFQGRVLIFKKLNIRVHEHSSNFRRVSNHLSLPDAIEILRQESSNQLPLEK